MAVNNLGRQEDVEQLRSEDEIESMRLPDSEESEVEAEADCKPVALGVFKAS